MSGVLTEVAVYRRTVEASLVRVWENVDDWEHLPWLHHSTFREIVLEEEADWGWRARVALQPTNGAETRIELRRTPPGEQYVVTTLEGPGTGTEIWTRLEPDGDLRTRVEVRFLLPDVPAAQADSLGRGFTALYTRLWDEDEAMMKHRTAELARSRASLDAEPVALGTIDTVRARVPFVVDVGGLPFRVIDDGGELVAHAAVCPHRLGPLSEADVEDGCVRCPWHGYRFDVRTGRSADGRGLRLAGSPKVVVDENDRVRLIPGG